MQNLQQQLRILNSTLDQLISITYEEIDLIKSAQHHMVNARQQQKQTLLKAFEEGKERLNKQLLEISQADPSKPMEALLDEEVQNALQLFRQKLQTLHQANKVYGTFVATLSEFFTSLVAAILPMNEEGYHRSTPKPAAFLQVSA